MAEEYSGSAIIKWMNNDFKDNISEPSHTIMRQIADMKESYIKGCLRYPFNIMPFTKIAAKFLVLNEQRPTFNDEMITVNVKLTGNPRYPKWISKIFLRGE